MLIEVAVVRRETERALQLILGTRPYRIVWVPKSQIRKPPKAGERNLSLDVPGWIVDQWEKENES